MAFSSKRESALVTGARPHCAIKTRHSFGVVVENIRLRVEHDLQRFFQTLKIRNQHFDPAIGNQLANLADGFGKNLGASDVVIVTIHAGHDSMLQAQRRYSLSHPSRLIPVDRLGAALGHGAESAAAGADIAQQHEGRSLVIPALADVRALCRFANRVQSQPARQLLKLVKIVADGSLGAQPVRLGHPRRRRKLDLN